MTDAGTAATDPSPERLPASYPAAAGFDEAVDDAGQPRPHYAPLLEDLARLLPRERQRRAASARRLVQEQGVTYHVYGDRHGSTRPWRMDPVPLVISAEEWRRLQEALIQRATLLDTILADCYGAQNLMREGRLPPALVLAQADFLRAACGIRPPGGRHLVLYGADLARSPDGSWWVVSDRTQIPTGAGYALANRLVTSRVMPESFRDGGVQRLAGFFREMQATLAAIAPGRTESPRVVLLTPGSYNETYFEQAYLARYLGYTLVEGQDLTVRERRVYLKTLSGLEPVDVILRRVDDEFCDPLELRNDSVLGVPGLVEAWRAGNVAIANGLGSGLVQNPAFLAFLPGLCRHLLGEDLKLPSIATWWCGQPAAAGYVAENLDRLYLKPAFRAASNGLARGPADDAAGVEALRRQLAFQPHLYVAQERIVLSRAPAWTEDGLVPRPVGLRVYLVASRGSYKVMPGGLTRVAADPGSSTVSMQRGGTSKDTWVPGEGPVARDTLLAPVGGSVALRRVGNNLPSRMADNFFWLGRYVERADATCRLLRSAVSRGSTDRSGEPAACLAPILATLRRTGQLAAAPATGTPAREPAATESDLLAAVFDPSGFGSLRHHVAQMFRLTGLVRERTSLDLWRVIGQLHDRLEQPPGFRTLASVEGDAFLQETILGLASIHGLAMENMTRAQGWRFLDMGHRIERVIYLCAFLDCSLCAPLADDASVLEAVLEVVDTTITYRSRYNLLPDPAAVYDLVLLDETNPRSLLFQLECLADHFRQLPREQRSALPTPAQRALLDALHRLRLADPTELGRPGGEWAQSGLATVVRDVGRTAPAVSDALAVSYFAHSVPARPDGPAPALL